jgi:hypothetical protein
MNNKLTKIVKSGNENMVDLLTISEDSDCDDRKMNPEKIKLLNQKLELKEVNSIHSSLWSSDSEKPFDETKGNTMGITYNNATIQIPKELFKMDSLDHIINMDVFKSLGKQEQEKLISLLPNYGDAYQDTLTKLFSQKEYCKNQYFRVSHPFQLFHKMLNNMYFTKVLILIFNINFVDRQEM